VATVTCFQDLEACKQARELVRAVYEITKTGPLAKDFELRNQMRDAAISSMSNIAEGFDRGGTREFIQFLSIAKGSAGEVESDLYAAIDQQYISTEQFEKVRARCLSVKRLVGGFMQYLQHTSRKGVKFNRSLAAEEEAPLQTDS
jgi:four helix bundle protein